MTFAEKMKSKAQELQKPLVLPEGTEPRTIGAARIILDEKIASQVYMRMFDCAYLKVKD